MSQQTTSTNEVIRIENLGKTFVNKGNSVEALKDINLSVNKGDIFGIVGVSGAGKSTLARCINLLEKPTSGKITVNGVNLAVLGEKSLNKQRQKISMIFQHFNLFSQRTVRKNVAFPLEVAGVDKKTIEQRVDELLGYVGLSDKADSYPSQLSGGQKQRVAIAGIIAMNPDCIVLDEPTAMLDPHGRREVLKTIQRLNKEHGTTVILITHFMDEAASADRVVVVDGGKVLMDDVPKAVFLQVERMKEIGLDVPQVTELAYELNKAGIPFALDVLTVEEFAAEFKRMMEA